MNFSEHADRIVDCLGDDYAYTPSGGDTTTVKGIFRAGYYSALGLVEANKPNITCMASAVPVAKRGDSFVVGGVTYRVTHKEADSGTGKAVLFLELA